MPYVVGANQAGCVQSWRAESGGGCQSVSNSSIWSSSMRTRSAFLKALRGIAPKWAASICGMIL